MLHALVHPEPPHQLTDLVRQLNLVPLRRHLEEQPRVLLKVNLDHCIKNFLRYIGRKQPLGTIHKGRPQNVRNFGFPPPCLHFVMIYSTNCTKPPLLLLLGYFLPPRGEIKVV